MNQDDISKSTLSFLNDLLRKFHKKYPDTQITGLACEVSLEVGALYVFLCNQESDNSLAVDLWPLQFVEQDFSSLRPLKWKSEFDALLESYYNESVDYSEIESAINILLKGVSKALNLLVTNMNLPELGFIPDPVISVFTADDDNINIGIQRVKDAQSINGI